MAIERFTKDHEWIRVDGGIATVGITDHAQSQLGDVVFVERARGRGARPSRARRWRWSKASRRRATCSAPVSGEVVEANADLAGQPALVNEDAEGKAWFFKLKIADPAELDTLMDRAAYEAFVKESH